MKSPAHGPSISTVRPMYYVLIQGPSYRGLDFDSRERVREDLRLKLESNGVRYVEYCWVWDEKDRCQLLVGRYHRLEDARWWMAALRSFGFELSIRTELPGSDG
ncbi:MAG: hypothetical protein JRF59_13320 [Deltaproteobacteria bacterium]|nr:hypothetical protein [Deltaproteobacteria bacterium]MBW1925077.1 hypothetical protein [Deltaproteobacteria bacterium]MBW2102579.1 hypothetical protein [Deltaproteobacteria bacterium]MBW2348800.1 hypothetical protein [Deltaproteobacteria bacterium]RLB39159.1 MAG: hypothetical protein DRH20_04225 [Deltaproteobacteria bacterium]